MRPATVPRTANEIRLQTCKALLGAAEIISPDTISLQRAWALILTRSKPLKKYQCPRMSSDEIATRSSAAHTRPLNSLLRKGVKFELMPHHERIVRDMLDELYSPNVLAFSDFEAANSGLRKFRLITDASADGLGVVIEQQPPDGSIRLLRYLSRTTLDIKRKWSISELECTVIVQAIRRSRKMYYGIPFF